MKGNKLTLAIGGLLALALGAYWCSFTVRAGSVVVVKTLGAISEVAETPGLALKWPWPIQSATRIDTRTRILAVPGNEVLTKDKFNIIVTVAVGWRVRSDGDSVRRFVSALQGSIEGAEDKLVSRIKSARKQVVNGVQLQDLVSTEAAQPERFRAFEEAMRGILQKGLDEAGYGLAVEFLYVQSIKFPKDVTERVFERMIKERERVSEKTLAEGRSRAKAIRDEALTEREKKLADAEAQAIRIRGEADAEVAEAYKVFRRNPELASWLRKLDALGSVLSKRATVVLPTKDPLGTLIEEAPAMTPRGP